MDKLRILLADDDSVFCDLVRELLSANGCVVDAAMNLDQAYQALLNHEYDLMMLDLCFPALSDGFELLDAVHARLPQLLVLMISGSGSIQDAVRAIKSGADDFITKPIDPEHLLVRVRSLGDRVRKQQRIQELERTAIGMVGVSEQMRQIFDHIGQAARYDTPVLLTGETGVGKELAARAIHRLSACGKMDMLSINCASVPRDLFEAQLFGYEQGAFTGAVRPYKGYFEFARDSSLFLDEISELSSDVQGKLLRVLSEGEAQQLGGKVHQVNVRIISASNQDLQAAVRDGRFRQDLFYRLNVIHIHIPPLRERPEDILPLARHFLLDFCQRKQLPPREISPRSEAWLNAQNWPGNCRELRNCVERALILASHELLEPSDFLDQKEAPASGTEYAGTLRESLKRYEARLISQQLKANHYNVTQTAHQLGLDKSNLWKRIHALGLEPPG